MVLRRYAVVLEVLAIVVGGVGLVGQADPGDPAPGQGAPLNLGILWHMHQPLYKNILTGKYEMPWVRDHAPGEYLDHPKILGQYPGVNVTFNLVPSLVLQIEDYVAGAIDNHVDLARIDLAAATPDERRAIAQEFIRLAPWYYTRNTTDGRTVNPWYDTYPAWPRLNDLVRKVSANPLSLNDTELQDLETIFFLHQVSIPYIEGRYNPAERNNTVVQLLLKGGNYTQADTETVLSIQRAIMAQVVPAYKAAQDGGQAEVVTTPFYHPIAPLLMAAEIPSEDGVHNVSKGVWDKDLRYQYANASAFYLARFGIPARGVWHSEQSVSQSVIPAAVDAGFTWTSSDEGVLWKSYVGGEPVGKSLLNRTRTYTATDTGRTIDIVFRDTDISNRVSFSYGGMPTDVAVADFMRTLQGYHDNLTVAERQNGLVVLAADGENWMFMAGYPNDGRDFLNALYQNLSAAQAAGWLRTWRIGDFLAQPGLVKVPLSTLHAGSWIDADFRTWSGEEEEQVGWARLAAARRAVVSYTLATEGRDFVNATSTPAVKRAWEAIFTAEGSDWFWWYGDDQSSGDDGKFDLMMKAHLYSAYATIGATPPRDILRRWGQNATPDQPGNVTEQSPPPTMDGAAAPGEWANATGWTQVATGDLMRLRGVYAFADASALYLRVDLNGDATVLRATSGRDVEVYISYPVRVAERDMEVNLNRYGVTFATRNGGYTFEWAVRYRLRVVFSQALSAGVTPWSLFAAGAGADHLGDGTWVFQSSKPDGASVGPVVELLLPLSEIAMGPGDLFRFAVVTSNGTSDVDLLPGIAAGPGQVRVLIPRAGPPIAIFPDPLGDDTGDGDYTYAQSPDFRCRDGAHCEDLLYDFTYFNISDAPTSVTFTFTFADIGWNQWGGPNGFSFQIVNVYIDADRVPNSGNLRMLEGANAEVTPGFAWEAAVQAAGWSDARTFVTRDPAVSQRLQSGLLVRAVPGTNAVEVTVPKALLPAGDPKSWGYVVVAGGQDGFGPGWWRPVAAISGTWVFGGAGRPGVPPGNHPRVFDAILPAGVDQRSLLGSYTGTSPSQLSGVTVQVNAPGTPTVTVGPAPLWRRGDTITVNWTAQPNPVTLRPIESYDVRIFYTPTDPIASLAGTTLNSTTFTVGKEHNVTIRATAFDGFATSPPFVQEYGVRRSPPPPPVNRAPILTNPAVQPVEGDERTVFEFSVRYVDPDGDSPLVSLLLDGSAVAMRYVGGGNSTGSIFRAGLSLPAGAHAYRFRADDRNGTANSTVETAQATLTVRPAGTPIALVAVAGAAVAIVAVVGTVLLLRRRRPPAAEPTGERLPGSQGKEGG